MTDQPKPKTPSLNDLLRSLAASPRRTTTSGTTTRDELNRALRRAAGHDVPEHNLPPPFPWASVADVPDDPEAA